MNQRPPFSCKLVRAIAFTLTAVLSGAVGAAGCNTKTKAKTTCGADGDTCGLGGTQCCSGLSCDASGYCRPPCTLVEGACQPYGALCGVDTDCCAPSVCLRGSCSDASARPACALEGETCTDASDCCGDSAAGTRFDCVAANGGTSVCGIGQVGDACDGTHHCAPGLICGDGTPGASGTCGITATSATCTLMTATCAIGDACDLNAVVNEGIDPCMAKVSGQNLVYRATVLACNSGRCTDPLEGQLCSQRCTQSVGDSRVIACVGFLDGSNVCMPSCATDVDCTGASRYDTSVANPQPITNFCVSYGAGSGCQPDLCFADGQAGLDDPSVLYAPCGNHADALCLPRYVGDLSVVAGFCMSVRSDAAASVGAPCDPLAGREAEVAICGTDALCLGGLCAPICDASQLGGAGTATCPPWQTCISPQGVDLVAGYQVGGCGTPCDPFATEENAGCVDFCGGPPARCNWIVGDPVADQPRGYCGAALEVPVLAGQPCARGAVDPCEAGARCLFNGDGVTRTCARLCDPTVDPTSPDACPSGQTCTAFDPLKRSGYCQ